MEIRMTFNEKSRWIALLANLLVWGWYFVTVVRVFAAGAPDVRWLLAMTVPVLIALTVIHVVAHIVVAVLKPSEARSDMDERERAIARRAGAIAYNVLSFGIVAAIATTLFYWNTFVAVNAILFVFIVSESVRYALELAAYRRMAV
jgi:uncharacterized membrane protein